MADNSQMNSSSIAKFISVQLSIASVLFGIVVIEATALQWEFEESLTPFCMGPVLLLLHGVLLILVLTSAIHLLIQVGRNWKLAVLPLAINLSVVAILWFVPFTSLWLAREFRMNWEGYNEVVALVEAGEIQPYSYDLAPLPSEYCRLSRGCEILIDRSDGVTRVFFYTFRGVLDNFSGYMYRSDDSPPEPSSFGGDWHEINQVRPHWYWMASL